ncbi:MAG: hypothetical protein HFI64_05685 [Lachnospiraceae bacterium]|nr:hypothetical protein [Lachnospiraceae bacterium]
MKEYTAREMKLLKANPYTFKVTKNKLYFTIEFKETFWTAYQAFVNFFCHDEIPPDFSFLYG